MTRRLIRMIAFPTEKEEIIEFCKSKGLNGYEIELILRIYWKKQSLTLTMQ